MKKTHFFILVLLFIGCSKKDNPVSPNDILTAFIGDTITIEGKNPDLVTFGNVKCSIVGVSGTSVMVVVPGDIEAATVKIHLYSGANEITPAKDFRLKAPVIESVSPGAGPAGQQIVIKGKGFSVKQVSFGDKLLNVIDQSHNQLTIKVPDSIPTGEYTISVTVAGLKVTAAEPFNVILPVAPTFTGFSPQTAFIGDTITLEGSFNADGLTVNFGNIQATVLSASGTSAKVIVPDEIEAAAVKIQLTSGNTQLTSDKEFRLQAPVIDSISLTSGFSGQLLFIYGKGFRKSYKTAQITFGNTSIAANLGHPDNTELVMHVPGGLAAGKYAVAVTVAGMTATASDLFEVFVPAITSFTPHSGAMFTKMTITGTHLADANGGSTSVGFVDFETGAGSASAFVLSKDANQITVSVPQYLTGGKTYRIIVSVVGSSTKTMEAFTFIE